MNQSGDLGRMRSEISFASGLDRANQPEIARQLSLYAQRLCAQFEAICSCVQLNVRMFQGGSGKCSRFPVLATRGRHHSAFPRRVASGFCIGLTPKKEGAGNAGCVLHPRPRVQIVGRTHTRKTGTDGAIRHSLRNGLTAYAALSSATNSSCHRRQRIKVLPDPVGPTKPPRAWHQQRVSGPHGFAVR